MDMEKRGGACQLRTRIKELRRIRRLDQKDLAVIIGVSRETVSAWETGRKKPSWESILKLAETFDVTTDYLLGVGNRSEVELSGQVRLRGFSVACLEGFEPSAFWSVGKFHFLSFRLI